MGIVCVSSCRCCVFVSVVPRPGGNKSHVTIEG